jgi:tetratricopeptide (TPR) repeat protein
MLATARAYEWQRASPNSRTAIEALFESARAAGYVALYGRALQRLSALDGESDFQLPENIVSALGSLSFEQAEAIDLSRMHLADDNPAAAIAVLQGIDHPSARNNMALAFFVFGEVAQAVSVIEANWQANPDNLFALDSVIRWRCWSQGLDRCIGFVAPLRHTTPRRAEDAIAQISALRFLGENQAALLAWMNCEKAPYWKGASNDLREIFADLKEACVQLPGGSGMWFPGPWIRALTAIAGKSKEKWEQQWDTLLETCDAHVDYLIRAVDFGDAATRLLGLSVLKHRAVRSDRAALASVNALLTHPNGSDSDRMDLLNWLIDHGLRSRSESVEVWLSGELRTINSKSVRITDESRASPYPPEGTALNERVLESIGRRDLQQALSLAQHLNQMYPDQPMALVNLAGIKEGLKHPKAEVTDLYRQAYSMAPDYLFARCGLARCLAGDGQVEEAHKLLDGILDREEFHRSEYRSFLMAQHALALACGEHDAVRSLRASLVDLDKAVDD